MDHTHNFWIQHNFIHHSEIHLPHYIYFIILLILQHIDNPTTNTTYMERNSYFNHPPTTITLNTSIFNRYSRTRRPPSSISVPHNTYPYLPTSPLPTSNSHILATRTPSHPSSNTIRTYAHRFSLPFPFISHYGQRPSSSHLQAH